MQVKRYRCDPNSVMLCADDGEWVLYEDVEALRARLVEVGQNADSWHTKAMELEEQLTLARRELAKYKAFWDRSREIDKMNFELYDWPTKEKAGG